MQAKTKSRRLISRNPRSSILTGGGESGKSYQQQSLTQMVRHANAEEAEKEEFSAKFKQAKVTLSFSELVE